MTEGGAMKFRTEHSIVFPDTTSAESEECSMKPGTVFQRDTTAFAMQFEAAKAKANGFFSQSFIQSYLNELIIRCRELNAPALVQTEEIESS
jgi:hypothetical protein